MVFGVWEVSTVFMRLLGVHLDVGCYEQDKRKKIMATKRPFDLVEGSLYSPRLSKCIRLSGDNGGAVYQRRLPEVDPSRHLKALAALQSNRDHSGFRHHRKGAREAEFNRVQQTE